MSTAEEKKRAANPPDTEGQEEKQDGALPAIILFFIGGFIASLIVGWIIFPQVLYSKKPQPVEFSHALHNDMVDGCESCHFFREDGSYSGLATLDTCIDCHEEIMSGTEAEVHFVENYVWKNREVPWYVYSRQPPCVFFSHAAHVIKGEMDCVTCHGHIGESDYLRPYQENRVSGYSRDIWGHDVSGLFRRNSWDSMKMNDCANCHRQENVNQNSVQTQRGGCFVCHK